MGLYFKNEHGNLILAQHGNLILAQRGNLILAQRGNLILAQRGNLTLAKHLNPIIEYKLRMYGCTKREISSGTGGT